MDKSDHVKNALDVFQTIVRGNVPPGSEDFLRHMCVTAIDWHFKRQTEELTSLMLLVERFDRRLRALEYPERIFTDSPGPNIYPDTSRKTLENIIRSLQILHDRMHP